MVEIFDDYLKMFAPVLFIVDPSSARPGVRSFITSLVRMFLMMNLFVLDACLLSLQKGR